MVHACVFLDKGSATLTYVLAGRVYRHLTALFHAKIQICKIVGVSNMMVANKSVVLWNKSLCTGKKLKIGVSNIAGWGLFAAEAIKKDEFVREYLGEIITMREGDRRGLVYDQNKRTYLFTRDTCTSVILTNFKRRCTFISKEWQK